MTGVAAIVLAAGASSRFRARDASVPTKLVAELDGVPLVRLVANAALASRTRPVIVVTGHAESDVRAALDELDLRFVHNPYFASGLSGSLRTGLSALPPEVSGALILLGDMPLVSADLLDRLIEAHDGAPDMDAVAPVTGGQRGNPVLIVRPLFEAAASLSGDEGARRLLAKAKVLEIEIPGVAAMVDVDDPETLRTIEAKL